MNRFMDSDYAIWLPINRSDMTCVKIIEYFPRHQHVRNPAVAEIPEVDRTKAHHILSILQRKLPVS
jgi:hypothetical protein